MEQEGGRVALWVGWPREGDGGWIESYSGRADPIWAKWLLFSRHRPEQPHPGGGGLPWDSRISRVCSVVQTMFSRVKSFYLALFPGAIQVPSN